MVLIFKIVGTVETRVPRAGLPRPTNTLQKISLRTRLSKPGKPRRGFSLDERPLLERASRMLPRTKPKGSTRPPASWGSFLAKPALPPRQSAHGLCVLRRVTGAATRGDDSAAVAILMYKAVNKAAPSKGAARIAALVIRRPSAAPLQGRRHRGAHHEPQQRQPTVLAGRWLFSFGDAAPCHGPCP